MRKLMSLALALLLALSLAVPAFAYGTLGEEWTQEQIEAWMAEYEAHHGEEKAAFDADAWFAEHTAGATKPAYMERNGLSSEADFRSHAWRNHLREVLADEVYRGKVDGYRTEYPEAYAAFDPDAWLAQNRNCCYDSKEALMAGRGLADQQAFKDYMLVDWLDYQDQAARDQAVIDTWALEHPEEYAAFDPDTWEGALFRIDYSGSREAYMQTFHIPTAADFRREMTLEWVREQTREEEAQAGRDGWAAAHPDQADAFASDAWYESGYWGSYGEPKETFMADNGLDEAEFAQMMRNDWLDRMVEHQGQIDRWQVLTAEKPGETADFLARFDAIFDEQYREYYGSPEEYMAMTGMVSIEELYLELYQVNTYQLEAAARAEAQYAAFFADRGGVPGRLNVMVNGRYLAFPEDAQPFAEEGVTYVPASVLGPILGVELDSGSSGYVPLRESAGEAGWLVSWDETYQSAVLLNKSALAAELDRQFTVINRTFYPYDRSKTCDITDDITVSYTLFDTLHGDREGKLSGHIASRVKGAALRSTCAFDLTDLADTPILGLVENDILQNADYWSEDAAREALKRVTYDIQTDGDGVALVRSSLAGLLSQPLADTWLETDDVLPLTAGNLVARRVTRNWNGWNISAQSWDLAITQASPYLALLGDGRFTATSSGWTYALDRAAVAAAFREADGRYSSVDHSALLEGLELELRVDKGGMVFGSFRFAPDVSGMLEAMSPGGSLMTAAAPWMEMEFSGTFSGGKTVVNFHLKNTVKGSLTFTRTIRETTQALSPLPTENVFSMDEYYEYLAGLI